MYVDADNYGKTQCTMTDDTHVYNVTYNPLSIVLLEREFSEGLQVASVLVKIL